MKIAIGTNIFGSFHRQDTCIESLKRVEEKYPDIIDLYNIQPEENPQEENGLRTLPLLRETCKNIIPNCKKEKPMLKEMFKCLADLNGYDYFLFTNSDIILSDRFIKLILDNPDKDSFSGARLTIQDIETLDDEIIPIQYQVAGFDTIAIKTKWWKENEDKFPDYVYAEPCWDVHYATLLKKFGNSMFVNKWPAAVFHIHHEIAWSEMTPERQYNEDMLFKKHALDSTMWHTFLFQVLLKRTPPRGFYNPFNNEEELEEKMFNEANYRNKSSG